MSEKFTPSVEHFRGVYEYMLADWCRENELAQFDRMITTVKANTLREFADEWGDGTEGFPYGPLHERADGIEGEA